MKLHIVYRVKNIEPEHRVLLIQKLKMFRFASRICTKFGENHSSPNAGNETEQVDYDAKTRKLTIRIGEGANATKGGIYTDKTPGDNN